MTFHAKEVLLIARYDVAFSVLSRPVQVVEHMQLRSLCTLLSEDLSSLLDADEVVAVPAMLRIEHRSITVSIVDPRELVDPLVDLTKRCSEQLRASLTMCIEFHGERLPHAETS